MLLLLRQNVTIVQLICIIQASLYFHGIFKEAYEYAEQQCLYEGIFDKISKGVRAGVNFLKNMVKKMLTFIWKKVKSLLVSSIDKVLEIILKLSILNSNFLIIIDLFLPVSKF